MLPVLHINNAPKDILEWFCRKQCSFLFPGDFGVEKTPKRFLYSLYVERGGFYEAGFQCVEQALIEQIVYGSICFEKLFLNKKQVGKFAVGIAENGVRSTGKSPGG